MTVTRNQSRINTSNNAMENEMQATIQQKLSAAVVEKAEVFFDFISRGFSVREAFDKTMGDGAFVKLMGEVYDEIRAAHA